MNNYDFYLFYIIFNRPSSKVCSSRVVNLYLMTLIIGTGTFLENHNYLNELHLFLPLLLHLCVGHDTNGGERP